MYIKQLAYTHAHWYKNSVPRPGVRPLDVHKYKGYFAAAVYAKYYFSKKKNLDKQITDNSANLPKISPSKISYRTVVN